MKLDVNALRYLSREDFRVLTAVEMGQKNHEIVPVDLITAIAGLKHGGTYRHLRTLLRYKLVHHDQNKYDGYRLTYMGYDFLAIRTLLARGHISAVGRRIGVGKESDVFEVRNEEGEVLALKLHRLGRTSFRAVKNKRDYLKNRSSASFSWLYLSRLAALKEFAFMAALEQRGLPVPRAVDHNRHAVLMSLIDAYPLTQVRELRNPGEVYTKLMDFMERLAGLGLIHCDFNEFNVMVNDEDEVTIIDFPQMVSVAHPNGRELFQRDVDGVIRFFQKKLAYMPELDASLPRVQPDFDAILATVKEKKGLDVELSASGFKEHHQKALEIWQEEAAAAAGFSGGSDNDSDADPDADPEAGYSGSDGSADTSETAQQRSDGSASPAAEALDAIERSADAQSPATQSGGGGAAAAAGAADERGKSSGAMPAVAAGEAAAPGGDGYFQAVQAQLSGSSGSDGGVGSSSDGGGGGGFSDGEDSEAWGRGTAAASSVTGTARSRRRRQTPVGPQDVQRRVTALRQSAARRNAMAHASRNAGKRTSQKRRSDVQSSINLG